MILYVPLTLPAADPLTEAEFTLALERALSKPIEDIAPPEGCTSLPFGRPQEVRP